MPRTASSMIKLHTFVAVCIYLLLTTWSLDHYRNKWLLQLAHSINRQSGLHMLTIWCHK